ncbi:MAG: Ig-like domain-containing protein, partial [Patescibacteria group bacterium]|nr:Ig-like domain-containing protein [Patescibacteria group bacterium]
YGSEDTVSPWSISWDTTSINDGTHVITASARDIAGNSSISSSTSVKVDNDIVAPSVSISHSPTNPNNTQSVTFTVNASDSSGIYEIKIYTDNVLRKTCSLVMACSWVGGPYAGNTTHTYYATAKDNSLKQNERRDPATGTKSFYVTAQQASSLIDTMQIQINEITRQLQEILKKIYQ